MHVRHAPSPGEQRPNVPPRLCALESAEREPAVGNLGIFGVVGRDYQEQARVGTAFVELAGGVEVARAEAERGDATESPPLRAQRLRAPARRAPAPLPPPRRAGRTRSPPGGRTAPRSRIPRRQTPRPE